MQNNTNIKGDNSQYYRTTDAPLTSGHFGKVNGSNARAVKFTQERTKALAKRAALKRWGKK